MDIVFLKIDWLKSENNACFSYFWTVILFSFSKVTNLILNKY